MTDQFILFYNRLTNVCVYDDIVGSAVDYVTAFTANSVICGII